MPSQVWRQTVKLTFTPVNNFLYFICEGKKNLQGLDQRIEDACGGEKDAEIAYCVRCAGKKLWYDANWVWHASKSEMELVLVGKLCISNHLSEKINTPQAVSIYENIWFYIFVHLYFYISWVQRFPWCSCLHARHSSCDSQRHWFMRGLCVCLSVHAPTHIQAIIGIQISSHKYVQTAAVFQAPEPQPRSKQRDGEQAQTDGSHCTHSAKQMEVI